MSALKEALERIVAALGLNGPLLARARHRYGVQHKRAFTNHNQQQLAQRRADRFRREGNTAAAEREDAKAQRCNYRAYRSHVKAQFWLGRIKVLVARVEDLEAQKGSVEGEIRAKEIVKFDGNKATGGSARQRLRAIAIESAKRCASGRRQNFYSMSGKWDVSHCLTGEFYGERSDCSSWATSVYWSAGLKDPNGNSFTGGYTGTLGEHGKEVSRANLKPGDLVLYGPAPHHHVELYVGPGDKTIGHGSSPVDPGVINLFNDGDYHFRSYV